MKSVLSTFVDTSGDSWTASLDEEGEVWLSGSDIDGEVKDGDGIVMDTQTGAWLSLLQVVAELRRRAGFAVTTVICKDARTDLSDFFKLSGCLEFRKLEHHPFLAFLPIDSGGTEVRLCDSIRKLLELPDATPVLAQWGGQWRSDFFSFTVRDAREAWLARDAK